MRDSKRLESLGKGVSDLLLTAKTAHLDTSRILEGRPVVSCRQKRDYGASRWSVETSIFGCDAGHAGKYSNAIGPGRMGVKGCGLRSE